jgi:hypothetical protein
MANAKTPPKPDNDYCYLISYIGQKDNQLVNSSDNFYFDSEWAPSHLNNFIEHMLNNEGYTTAAISFIYFVGRYADLRELKDA